VKEALGFVEAQRGVRNSCALRDLPDSQGQSLDLNIT
jgi:hypothetical protein